MKTDRKLDCVVIGYNEVPFERYEKFLRSYGENTEAYRDLKYSFVDLEGKKLDYMGLLNHVIKSSGSANDAMAQNSELRSGDIPNLAAVYLTTFLRRKGFNARYINLFQYEKEKLKSYLAENPLCVAITTTFYVMNLPVNEMVEFIRSHNSNVKIVIGGPLIANHKRNNPDGRLTAALADIGADIYVIEGQGEATLARIVSCLQNKGDLNDIPNIAHFENGKLQQTATVSENNSLDENYIDWRDYSAESLGGTLQTRTARSCAFKCSFCNYPTRSGALTLASVDTVEKELDTMLEVGGIQNVVFIDDTFNVPITRFKDLCRMIIRKNYPFNWFSYFRCSNSDEETIELMAESGCKGVFLGIESGSPSVLVAMNKTATIEKYARGIEWLRKNGILTFGSFITGFPSETEATVNETIDFLRSAKPDYYRTQMWYCEPGTPIQNYREKYGIEGEGFVWRHQTMDRLEAMDHIDRIFLTVNDSIWLPQWSFDFWVIPFLLGKGISLERFREFMFWAQKLLTLEIAYIPANQKRVKQREYLQKAISVFQH